MRGSDEQLHIVRQRAARLRRRQTLLKQGAAAAVCLVLIAALGLALPRVSGRLAGPEGVAFGSLVLGSPALGYIVLAILAFALGVFFTLLCIHSRARRRDPEGRDR